LPVTARRQRGTDAPERDQQRWITIESAPPETESAIFVAFVFSAKRLRTNQCVCAAGGAGIARTARRPRQQGGIFEETLHCLGQLLSRIGHRFQHSVVEQWHRGPRRLNEDGNSRTAVAVSWRIRHVRHAIRARSRQNIATARSGCQRFCGKCRTVQGEARRTATGKPGRNVTRRDRPRRPP